MPATGVAAPASGPSLIVPADEPAAARFIAWLRDRMSAGERVRWSGDLPPSFDTASLHHLQPPVTTGRTPPSQAITAWQASFRPALYYYRKGPGFIQIKDVRDPAAAVRITLNDPTHILVFERCQQPLRPSELSAEEREALAQLTQAGLLLQLGEHLTTAPYRMSHWPISARLA
jgi:hypothetical protein